MGENDLGRELMLWISGGVLLNYWKRGKKGNEISEGIRMQMFQKDTRSHNHL